MKIAIVGLALRFPGDLDSEESFWNALKNSKDLVTEVSPERWGTDVYSHPRRSEPGRSISFSAGLLSRIDEFDAAFFGISPREARQMDPQQRLLLEMTWEALENGGHTTANLAGSNTAVYIGISGIDYGLRSLDDLSAVDAYTMTGNTLSIAANRISYVFDLHGPSMAIDTACSSSMVALHQACQSLRNGESSLAIAGGVNLLLHPYPFVGFTKASMLSADGRCKTFDASGDGYVRGEGGAILLLKPYEQAVAEGDRIHAVILGTGVNTDGYKSGITIPSATAQAALMRGVCKQAGVAAKDIVYIEAHGTGTMVGDPIEATAIGEAVGKAKSDGPLYVGSVKSNLGHLEPASGMAGLLKTVLCLKHRALPPSLHLETPNPHIDFAGLNLKPVTTLLRLPKSKTPLRMGVNSFGFGGANAHVLLEEARPTRRKGKTATAANALMPPLFLSARHPDALKALASRYAERIDAEDSDAYYDLAATAVFRRHFLEQRLAVYGDSPHIVAERLRDYAAGTAPAGTVEENVLPVKAKLAFVYSGNGVQWQGMGCTLMKASDIFRATVEEIDRLLAPLANFSLIEELNRDPATSRMHLTEVAQPALFAIQAGLTRLLRAYGLDAAAATGHSVGEVAAAWAMGALSLAQAVRVIHERSAAQALTRGNGRMAAVALSPEEAVAAIRQAGLTQELEIAGINAPCQITLSGSLDALERLQAQLRPRGTFFRLLDLDHAFHSRQMEPIRTHVIENLSDLEPSTGTGCFVSTVEGATVEGTRLNAEYWWRNVLEPVQFSRAIDTLIQDGYTVFLEVGPHAILQRYIGECLSAAKAPGRPLAMLRQNEESLDRVRDALYRAHLLGCPLDLHAVFPVRYRFVPLPTYPWQRERHWNSTTSEAYQLINRHRVHPLLGYRLGDAPATWENQLDPDIVPYLRDHVVGGAIVLPAAAYAELALAASAQHFGTQNHEIEELEIRIPILLDSDHARTIRFELNPQDGTFQIKSRARLSDDAWTPHAVGRLLGAPLAAQPEATDVSAANNPTAAVTDARAHYQLCSDLGLDYGPAFQGLQAAWQAGDSLLTELALPEAATAFSEDHILHPVLSDTCFQTLLALFHEEIRSGLRATLLPVRIGRLRLFGDGKAVRYCRTNIVKRSPHSVLADFRMLDKDGRVVAELLGCRFRGAPIALHRQHKAAEWVYTALLKPPTDPTDVVPLPALRTLKETAIAQLSRDESLLHRKAHFQTISPLFEALVSAFAHQALLALADANGVLSESSLSLFTDQPAKVAFQRWLLSILEEDGLAERSSEGWTLAADALATPQDIWLAILGDNPAYMPDLALAGRIGNHLPALLAEQEDAGNGSNAPGSATLMDQLLEASPTYIGANRMAQTIAAQVAAQWPENRRLRILEVGCCSRVLTRAILPMLPANRCDYVIAEQNDEALAYAEAEFAEHGHVTFMKLDPAAVFSDTAMPGEPGFDIVVVGHVLHRVAEPLALADNLRRKLNQGGLLMMLERHPERVADFTLALTQDGWTAHGSRLLSPAGWTQVLEQAGYQDIETVHEPAASPASPGAFIVLASNPEAPALPARVSKKASWLILADADGETSAFAHALKKQLVGQAQRATVVDVDSPLPALADFDHIVHAAGLAVDNDTRSINLPATQERRCISTLELIHAIEASGRSEPPRLWLVTGYGSVTTTVGGLPVPSRQIPSQSALWGLGRVIANEHPDLKCRLVDLRFESLNDEAVRALGSELLFPDDEDEVILCSDRRLATRMQRLEATPQAPVEPGNVCLGFHLPGQLKNLQWHTAPLRDPASDEIEIRPVAVGLNFRDVMYAMGLLSDEAVENGFAGPTMGMELAGVVTRVGKAVTEFKTGDAVIAFAPAGFASRAITKAESAVKKPDAWSFEEAATVPTVFFTVYYALHHLARLQPGEKVLIHGAAGGVGIAAIQVARYLGAEIFATAGSDEKREFVRLLGADHVMSSRNLAFADDILRITEGRGVDVVLNSLAGEAINRNFRVLRPFGRFLELGKRDFYENTKIGLRPFKDNITYYGIDADQVMVERPELTTRLFREMMRLFEQGDLRPIPYRVFPAKRIVDAYRYMQQAKQIGKIVISFAEGAPPASATAINARPRQPAFSRDGTYLVTGGLGGFGLETARWMAEHGAGHLVLLSRRGDKTPDAAAASAALEAAGATVHIHACDVTDPARLQNVLNEIERELPPLKGVVHAAMVLDDGLIRNLDRVRFNNALHPKMLGAWNLHRLTMHLPLELFVVYSSATTFIGNPGQANYVAANLYLESLIALRRAKGLSGTSVCWGAIGDVGYLARNADVKNALQSRLGGAALNSDSALEQLGEMIVNDRSGVAIIDFDWHTLSLFLKATESPRFEQVRRLAGKASQMNDVEDIHALIAEHSEDEVRGILQKLLTEEIAQILGLTPERIPLDRSLYDIGMDSLMGVELVLGIEKRFRINLPIMALSEGPTITRITERLLHMLLHSSDSDRLDEQASDNQTTAVLSSMAAQHGIEASPEEIEAAVDEFKALSSRMEPSR